jgi:cytochrome c-type biogenesis protein CcmE
VPPALTISGDDVVNTGAPPRKRVPLSFFLVGIAILGAVVYLVYANTQANAAYYMTVRELKQCTTCTVQTVRVAGIVQNGSIVRNDQQQQLQFTMADGGQSMRVSYSGVIPDIFRPGIQVVVEGHYKNLEGGQGSFQAQTLLAKCPSKFQSATPTP